MYPSMERGKLLEALGALRKVFLVAGKAFDVVDILGKPDERREAMRALHNEAIALTDDLDNVEDLEAVWVKLDVLLIRMASTASANSIADQPKGTGFRPASHFATNDEQGKYGLSIDKSWTDEAKAATAPLLPTEENLGFKFDLNDPHVDISSASSELASSFALWFGDDVRNWHPEEIADAALRFGIASGELMVRKTVKRSEAQAHVNSHDYTDIPFEMETYLETGYQHAILCCPVCGAKIIEG